MKQAERPGLIALPSQTSTEGGGNYTHLSRCLCFHSYPVSPACVTHQLKVSLASFGPVAQGTSGAFEVGGDSFKKQPVVPPTQPLQPAFQLEKAGKLFSRPLYSPATGNDSSPFLQQLAGGIISTGSSSPSLQWSKEAMATDSGVHLQPSSGQPTSRGFGSIKVASASLATGCR